MASANPYGTDLSCVTDFDPAMIEVGGNLVLAQACARRLITPRGQLVDDPNYGYDLQQFLNADLNTGDLAQIQSGITNELLKDERVQFVNATVTTTGETIICTALITAAAGPFTLVLAVTDVTVALLQPTG